MQETICTRIQNNKYSGLVLDFYSFELETIENELSCLNQFLTTETPLKTFRNGF